MSAEFAWVDAFLTDRRAAVDGLFVDTCTITRPGTGKGEFNDETGQYDDMPARVTVYTGKCRIQVTSAIAGSSDSSAGDRLVVVQSAEWQGPVVGTESIAVNDVIRIDSCANDSALEGREFTVKARHEKTHATSRRLRITEVTA